MFTGTTRFAGSTSHAGGLVTAIVLLTGTAILRGGAAAADSTQDDQFLALLDNEGIPALENVPSLVDTAHKVCRVLDAGISADRIVDAMVDYAYSIDPAERRYAPGRLARTEARFIIAAVGAYCPYDGSEIASIVTDPASLWNGPTHRAADDIRNAVSSRGDLMGRPSQKPPELASVIGVVPSGQITQPDPPQVPPPPPPVVHLQTPPRPAAAPPRPRQVPPPPQQPPPPAVASQPGAASGKGGSGIAGGGDSGGGLAGGPPPAPPAPPAPVAPPGYVRLAP
jgi:Protein of unknown function (DUF732)